jgi:flagellar hook protein FlgE
MAGSLSGFNIGIGGLRTSAGAIEAVSNNISNSNTVGYKVADYMFVDQFFRALNSTEVGRAAQGVSQTSVRRQFNQGAIRTTSSPLDLAINGNGFFRLCSKTGTDPGLVYYTRNGQLSADKDGYIVNATGLYLTGYGPNSKLDGVTNDVAPMRLPPTQKAPEATSSATLVVNLDARGEVKKNAGANEPKPFKPEDDTTYAHSTAFTVYDDAGKKSTVKVYYRRVNDGTASFPDESNNTTSQTVQRYKMYMSVTDVDGNTNWVKNTTGSTFETVSQSPSGSATGALLDTDTDAYALNVSQDATDPKTVKFFGGMNTESIYRDKKTGEAVNKSTVSFSIVNGQNKQPITFALTDTTRYSADFEVRDLSQDGYPIGALNAVSFDENGVLFGIYSNGQRLIAGQAVLAQFKGTEGLSPIAQNLFAQTVASGEALLGVPGSGSFGVVRNTALEEANIDMASELVNLMIQQRNYQANSESIRAQDELLKSTISLSR